MKQDKVTWRGYVLKSRVKENEEEKNRIDGRQLFESNVEVN